MSKTKEVIGRTGPFSQDERTTYTLQYKFDLGERFAYADQEAVDGVGSVFYERKDGSFKSGGTQALDNDLRKMYEAAQFEKGTYTKIIEYEADYE